VGSGLEGSVGEFVGVGEVVSLLGVGVGEEIAFLLVGVGNGSVGFGVGKDSFLLKTSVL
jgi:hypothetical protein